MEKDSVVTYRLSSTKILQSQITLLIKYLMKPTNIKEAARQLLDNLPENSTWEDLMHEIYVRQAIEAGLADSETGQLTRVEDVRKQFGLPQ